MTQNESLFEGTLYENITFGNPVNEYELKEVLQNLQLLAFYKNTSRWFRHANFF